MNPSFFSTRRATTNENIELAKKTNESEETTDLKKKLFLGQKEPKKPKKGRRAPPTDFRTSFLSHTFSLVHTLFYTHIYTTHLFSFDDVNDDDEKKKKKKTNFYRVSENI